MNEIEWQDLTDVWQTAGRGDEIPLQKIVRTNRRRMLMAAAGEIALAVLFLLMTITVAADGVAGWEAVWMATLWGFMLVAGAFAWWNRRGTWRPLGDSVTDYIRLSRLRCERQRRSVVFGIALFAAEAIVIVAQLVWFGRLTPPAASVLAASAVPIAAWCIVTLRRIERELRAIARFEA